MSTRLFSVLLIFITFSGVAHAGHVVRVDKPLQDQYIVLIKPDQVRGIRDKHAKLKSKPSVKEFANKRAQKHGARVERIYEHAVRGFSARMNKREAEALAADPDILLVEEDQIITIDTVQTNAPWGLDRIDQPDLPLNGTYVYDDLAANVHAYVIDTGIYFAHNDFTGRAQPGYDGINDGRNGNDCNGHGTHVAGTLGGRIYGVAKAVKLYAVRVLDCTGSGAMSGVIAGVDWVTANHLSPAVANMSLGGARSTALDNAVRNSIASGVSYAVAAGNSNRDACLYSPARLDPAITVAASTANDVRAGFSNYGTCVDLFAPGVDILSAWINGSQATRIISGTSMATPHTAGVAALYLSANPAAFPSEVEAALIEHAVTGRLSAIGNGSPNLLLQSRIPAAREIITLNNGEAVIDIADSRGGIRLYSIEVPVDVSELRVNSTGGSGNADLYLRFGATPDLNNYDCRSTTAGNNELCVITNPSAGTYYVMLYAVTDYTGLDLTASYIRKVANQPPVANFASSIDGLRVQFTDMSRDSDGTIARWQWSFGDGSSSTQRNPIHVYSAGGDYTVSLTVTDDRGATDTHRVVINLSAPSADPCTACETYRGSLVSGQTVYQPNGTFYFSNVSGVHEAWLEGPVGTNFNLALYRWNGRRWITVASSTNAGSSEHVRYSGAPGYYSWALSSVSGNGEFRFWMSRP